MRLGYRAISLYDTEAQLRFNKIPLHVLVCLNFSRIHQTLIVLQSMELPESCRNDLTLISSLSNRSITINFQLLNNTLISLLWLRPIFVTGLLIHSSAMRVISMYIFGITLLTLVNTSCVRSGSSVAKSDSDTLTVLSFNILYGGDEFDFNKTVELIKRVNPDFVGIQEAEGNIPKLAEALGWKYYDARLHLLSKFPILTSEQYGWYFAYLEIRPGKVIAVSNIHLPSDPYGPELVRDGKSRSEALQNEYALRYHELDVYMHIFDSLKQMHIPIVLTGDFNSPSHRDWNDTVLLTRSHMHYTVDWPVSRRLEDAGFVDAYRKANPDVLTNPGLTWTPGYPNAPLALNETHDRIDFIWSIQADTILSATLAGEVGARDVTISVDPYPSDHRAVIAQLVMTPVDASTLLDAYHYSDYVRKETLTGEINLSLKHAVLASGEPIEVSWSNAPGHRFDWIAVYPDTASTSDDYYKSELSTNYLVYVYTKGKSSGTLMLDEHAKGDGWPLAPGKYKVHFLVDDGYTSSKSVNLEITQDK